MSAKKLFRVTLRWESTVVVVAEDSYEAEREAEKHADSMDVHFSEADWSEEITTEADLRDWKDLTPANTWGTKEREWSCERWLKVLRGPGNSRVPPDEGRGPVCWCQRCLHERVQVDFQRDRQLCEGCEAFETGAIAA